MVLSYEFVNGLLLFYSFDIVYVQWLFKKYYNIALIISLAQDTEEVA